MSARSRARRRQYRADRTTMVNTVAVVESENATLREHVTALEGMVFGAEEALRHAHGMATTCVQSLRTSAKALDFHPATAAVARTVRALADDHHNQVDLFHDMVDSYAQATQAIVDSRVKALAVYADLRSQA